MKTFTDKKAFVLAVLLGAFAWTPQAEALCFGLSPSASGCNGPGGRCQGTSGPNKLTCLDPAGCVMEGGANDDFLVGGPGDDAICGGSGNDVAFGMGGKDSIKGDDGVDAAFGDASFFTETDLDVLCDAELVFTCNSDSGKTTPLAPFSDSGETTPLAPSGRGGSVTLSAISP